MTAPAHPAHIFTDSQRQAASECLDRLIPFVLFMFPSTDGERDEAYFMASLPDDDGRSQVDGNGDYSFFISRFAADEEYTAGVSNHYSAEDLLELIAEHPGICGRPADVEPTILSTERINYRDALVAIRSRVRRIGGKGVLSRVQSLFTTVSPVDSAEDYFAKSPHAFRYLCFTPETGIWLGATPELLLESHADTGTVRTMAMAGTMVADSLEEWDEKNLNEHDIVVDFIANVLDENGLKVTVGDLQEMKAGAVVHLVTPIEGHGNKPDAERIIHDLSPTPAVAGMPREIAIAEIDSFETHRRHCYTGVVGVRTRESVIAFVNLRCAFGAHAYCDQHSGWLWNLYGGGGIMAASTIDGEWRETEMKLRPLTLSLTEPSYSSGSDNDEIFINTNPYDAKICSDILPF